MADTLVDLGTELEPNVLQVLNRFSDDEKTKARQTHIADKTAISFGRVIPYTPSCFLELTMYLTLYLILYITKWVLNSLCLEKRSNFIYRLFNISFYFY